MAVSLIDMNEHHGAHPRMGAVDVVPFVPVRDVTIEDAVDLARGFAKEFAETLGPPGLPLRPGGAHAGARVARRRPPRRIRGLARRRGPWGAPARFRTAPVGPAGATAVGARKPLIAFNVYLTGTDEAAAKAVARTVRESSGGLPAVRAIGFIVPERGCVTVSMNLIDHERTGLRDAFAAVTTEAPTHDLDVVDAEIVGLVPEAALAPGDIEYLRLVGFDPQLQVLERLAADIEEDG